MTAPTPGSELASYVELLDVLDALPMLLREARRRRGHSQRVAAVEMGLSFSTVSRIEGGVGDPALSNVKAVLEYVA